MRILTIILIIGPFISKGQIEKSTSSKSIIHYIVSQNSLFIDSSDYRGNKTLDTLYYADKKIKAIGFYAAGIKGKKTYHRVGLWTEYYNNGEIKSIGNYLFNLILGCCSAMPCNQFNPYKVGDWTYYYPNGQIKAKGIYKVEKIAAKTGVANQFSYNSLVTDTWSFFDIDGQATKDKKKIISDLERLTL